MRLALAAALLLATAAPAPAAELMSPDHLAKLRRVVDARISPDGAHVAYVLRQPRELFEAPDGAPWTELWVVGSRGGDPRPYVTGEVNVSHLRWTPDGRALSYTAKRAGDDEPALYRIPLHGGESRKLLTHSEGVGGYAWSPDGRRLAFLGEAKRPERDTTLRDKGFGAKVVEEQDRPVRVWLVDVDPAAKAPHTTDDLRPLDLAGSASALEWSPRGPRLLLALAPTSGVDDYYMRRKLHVVDTEQGKVVASIDNPGKIGHAAWSPDGNTIAFQSAADYNDAGQGRLMVVPATGGAPQPLLRGLPADIVALGWQGPKALLAVVHQGTDAWLERINVDGRSRKRLSRPGGAILTSLSASRDGKRVALLAHAPGHPPEVYSLTGSGGPKRLTDHNPWLADVRQAPQESITYKARDGLEIQGVLVRPLDERPGQRYPLILFVHGGPESHLSNGWLTWYAAPGQIGAARGYAVFYPNYRGSTGRGVAFGKRSQADYAGGEFEDLVDGIQHLASTGLIDPERVGITGGSYGGFAAAWAATALTEHFAASVMFVGISDHVSRFGTTDIPEEMFAVHSRRWPWEHWDWFRERSPIYHSTKARTPLLILHGEDDARVPVSQGKELFRYLDAQGHVPVRLVLYPGEGHGNRKGAARYDVSLRLMRWMNHYLKGPGGDPPPHDLPIADDALGLKTDAAD